METLVRANGLALSIHARHACNIANHHKKWELRKNINVAWAKRQIEKNGGFYCLMYVTRGADSLIKNNINGKYHVSNAYFEDFEDNYYGLVAGMFWCDGIKCFEYETISRDMDGYWFDDGKAVDKTFLAECCVKDEDFRKYYKRGKGVALHVSRVKMFPRPMKLIDILRVTVNGCIYHSEIAPQSWCYTLVQKGMGE